MGRDETVRVGVLGGSFNPIHNAHMAIARDALVACALNKLLFLPTGNPPHKREGLTDKWDRLRMVELALADAGEPRFQTDDQEVRRQGVTYTVDTLRALHARWPGAALWYIIGADTLSELPTWKEPDEVLALCGFIVCTRPGWGEEEEARCASQLRARGANIRMLRTCEMDISSTMIRRSLARGERSAEALVPPPVWRYLRERRLYGPEPLDGTPTSRNSGGGYPPSDWSTPCK